MRRSLVLFMVFCLLLSLSGPVASAEEAGPPESRPSGLIGHILCQLLEDYEAHLGLQLQYSLDGTLWHKLPIQAISADGTTQIDWQALANEDGLQLRFYLYHLDEGVWKLLRPEDYGYSIEWSWKNEVEIDVTITIPYCRKDITATKVWQGGPSPRPSVWLKLYRAIPGGEPKPVDVAPIELVDGKTSATWAKQPRWANLLVPYCYSVKEVDVEGNDFAPEGYEKTEQGLCVTNTYQIPKGEITATKQWIDGPAERPEIFFQLFLADEAITEPTLVDPATNRVTWQDLPLTDFDGVALAYTVKEVDAKGNDATPAHYVKQEQGLSVTNRYTPPTGPVVATKEWIHGPKDRPEVYLQLFLADQAVSEPTRLDPATNQVIWPDRPLKDMTGQDLIYTVKEVDEDGKDAVPANYTKQESGLKVINTYVVPTKAITAAKIWIGGDYKKRPAIELQLLRDGEPLGEPVTLDNQLSYTWRDMPLTDLNGKEYSYTVDELNVPEGYEKKVLGMIVTNRYTAGKPPVKPDRPPIAPVKPTPPASPAATKPSLPSTGVGPSLLPWIILCLGSARVLRKKD